MNWLLFSPLVEFGIRPKWLRVRRSLTHFVGPKSLFFNVVIIMQIVKEGEKEGRRMGRRRRRSKRRRNRKTGDEEEDTQ